jgi:hypothetical protein
MFGIVIRTCAIAILLLAIALPIMAASDWREEWEKVLSSAKQEGRLVIYTFPGQELVCVLADFAAGVYFLHLKVGAESYELRSVKLN